jgi:putative transposase
MVMTILPWPERYPTAGAVHPINWKAKYAGLTVSEARRLKELEAENSKLKKLLAEAELDKSALKDLLHRKW